MRRFSGKTALVTGGASGIGKALAGQLVAHGAQVLIADLRGADEAADELGCAGTDLDVTQAEAVARVVREFACRHGRLDYLFNNAGMAIVGDTASMTAEDWSRLLAVNLHGVVHGVQAAYPLMVRQGYGHLVNTASAAGLLPIPGAVAYATSKHAVVGLSTSLRAEGRRHGVRVSALCPSFVRTPIANNVQLLGRMDRQQALAVVPWIGGWMPVEAFARCALQGVARNEAVIVAPLAAQVLVGAAQRFPVVGRAFAALAAEVVGRLG